jgi:hypothetical protein
MQIRTDEGSRGWIRAGLAVVVSGVLGGGVLTIARDTTTPRKTTADGVAAPRNSAAADKPLDLAGPAPAGEAPRADPVVGDKVDVGSDGGSVTVMAVEDNVSAGRLFGAGPGQKYFAAEVKGCAGPHEKDIVFDPGWFMVRLDDGTMRDHGPGAMKPELDGGPVPAGRCLSGWVTFTVPEGAYATGVVYDGSSRLVWTVPLPKGAKPTITTTGPAGSASPTTTTTDDRVTTSSTTKAKATTTTTARTATARATKTPATTATTAKTAATEKSSEKATGKAAATTTTTTSRSKSTTTTTGTTARASTTTTAPAE